MQQVIAETGALKGKTRRALDSTVLDDAVATQDTVTQLIAGVRRVRREVPGAAAVVARGDQRARLRRPGQTARSPGTTSRPAGSWSTRWSATLWRSLAAVGEQPSRTPAADAVGLLALVAGQDVELVDPDDPGDRPGRGGGSPAGSPRTG